MRSNRFVTAARHGTAADSPSHRRARAVPGQPLRLKIADRKIADRKIDDRKIADRKIADRKIDDRKIDDRKIAASFYAVGAAAVDQQH